MSTTVGRVYRFRAIHALPEEFGEPWCYPHEHDYRIEVIAEGGTQTDRIDRVMEKQLYAIRVNGMGITFDPSTVENVAERTLANLRAHELPVVAVKVWEDEARWGLSVL